VAYVAESLLDRVALRLGQALIACEQMAVQIEEMQRKLNEKPEKTEKTDAG